MKVWLTILVLSLFSVGASAASRGEVDTVYCDQSITIDSCIARTISRLADSAYYDAQLEIVGPDSAPRLIVHRGAPFTCGQLKLIGISDTLLQYLPDFCDPQDLLTRAHLDAMLNGLILLHAEKGYPFAQINVIGEQVASDTLILDCRLLTGPHTVVGRIIYEGLTATRPQTLSRRLSLQPGDWFSESEYVEDSQTLRNVDFCRLQGEPSVRFNSRNETVELLFPMHDRRNLSINGGLLVLPEGTLAGNLDLLAQNLLGGGRRFALSWDKKDASSRRLRIAVLLPYFATLPFDLGLNLSQEERDSAYVTTGIASSLDYHAGPDWLVGAGITWEKVTPPEGGEIPSARTYGFRLTTTYDQRDGRFDTRAGALLHFSFDSHYRKSFAAADSVVSGYGSVIAGDLHHWLRLQKQTSLYNRLQLFQVTSDFSPVPADLLVAVGGSTNLRGYREREFLARQGIVHTLEMQWHPLDRLMLRLFVDNAYLKTSEDEFGLTGFGSGFSVDTNLGRVRFDLSLGEEKSLDKLLVHFGFESEW